MEDNFNKHLGNKLKLRRLALGLTQTKVAKAIYSNGSRLGKRVQCQGGAKNFIVVMPDANLESTVPALITSFYGCAGERCLSGAVMLAVGDIYEPLKEMFLEEASKLKVGYGLDETTQMGPLVSKKHKDRVLSYIEKGIGEGAKLILEVAPVRSLCLEIVWRKDRGRAVYYKTIGVTVGHAVPLFQLAGINQFTDFGRCAEDTCTALVFPRNSEVLPEWTPSRLSCLVVENRGLPAHHTGSRDAVSKHPDLICTSRGGQFFRR